MIKLLGKIPAEIYVACSGGVDSMAALDFLRRRHDVTVIFVHHGTENSTLGQLVVAEYCTQHQIPMLVSQIDLSLKTAAVSWEEFWREQRYQEFDRLDLPVVTAHHLDDCVETYIWSMCHGTAKVIPHQRNQVIRPFLLNTKQCLAEWCQRHQVSWHDDTSNWDTKYTRNRVRHDVMPRILEINPGIHKVVRRIVEKKFWESVDKQTAINYNCFVE
jgi:tRNA(Ile)-lysidine synthase